MSNIVKRNTNIKVKKVTIPKTPEVVNQYGRNLKQFFTVVGIVAGAAVIACTPFVALVWLLIGVSAIPAHPVHNGWWIALIDIVLSVFWYTAAYTAYKHYEEQKRGRRYR